jgi:hypothetical protein
VSAQPQHGPDVLDRNLALLLTRAYVPVRPSAAFRASLHQSLSPSQALNARVRPHSPAPARPLPRLERSSEPRRARVFALRLAAAALVLALGAFFLARALSGGTGGAPGRACDEFLAHGDAAVRVDGGAWRAFDARERANGLEHSAGSLELATPRDHGALVWLAGAGSAAFEGESRASLVLGGDGAHLALDFTAGALVLERLAAGGAWRVHTTQGDFELARGKLELAYVGPELAAGGHSLRARLVWGAASFLTADGALALDTGVAQIVRAGRASEFAPLAAAETGVRTNAANPTPAPAATESAAPAAPATQRATLRARLALPAGHALAGAWRLSVMRGVRLPEVGAPEVHTFDASVANAELGELEPGVYELFATLPGFGDWRARDVALGAGETLAIVITPLAPARVAGRVLDARTGAPLEGAYVVSETDAPAAVLPFDFAADTDADWKTWTCLARTGPDGRFELAHLSAGRHVVRASAPGRAASWTAPIELEAGASADDVALRLGEPGHIVALVSDAIALAPRAGTPLVIASRVEFDAQHRCISYGLAYEAPGGRAEIGDLTPGLYVVFEITDGRASASMRQVVVRAGETTEVALSDGERGARLHGTLRLASGEPAAAIDLALMPRGGALAPPGDGARWINERSDASGAFAFPALAPGTYEVYAGRGVGTHFAVLGTLDVPDVNEFAHDFVLGAGELAGVVSRTVDAAPLANAQVILERETAGEWTFAGRYVTDGLGHWHAEFLPPGRLRASAYTSAGRLAPAHAGPFELTPDAASELHVELALEPGAELGVSVRDEAGAALANVALEFLAADGARQHFSRDDVTDTSGRFGAGGIAAGRWTIRAKREGFAPVERTIELYVGERHLLELVLAADSAPGPTRPR